MENYDLNIQVTPAVAHLSCKNTGRISQQVRVGGAVNAGSKIGTVNASSVAL